MKVCSKCKVNKDENSFYKDNRTKDGLYSCCISCHNNKWRKYRREYKKAYIQKHVRDIRKKVICRRKFAKLVERKKIVRQPCVKCGELNAQGHHENYNKPFEVMWLCRKHHMELHREKRNQPSPKE